LKLVFKVLFCGSLEVGVELQWSCGPVDLWACGGEEEEGVEGGRGSAGLEVQKRDGSAGKRLRVDHFHVLILKYLYDVY
jgi:hypothetical protein